MTSCPRCLHPLQHQRVRSAAILGCPTCGGVWLDTTQTKTVFQRMPGGKALLAAAEQAVQTSEKAHPHTDGTVQCPICGDDMVRGEAESIVIDQCPPHGSWFDPHELGRIVARADRDPAPEPERTNPQATSKPPWAWWNRRASDEKPDAGDWIEGFFDALYEAERKRY